MPAWSNSSNRLTRLKKIANCSWAGIEFIYSSVFPSLIVYTKLTANNEADVEILDSSGLIASVSFMIVIALIITLFITYRNMGLKLSCCHLISLLALGVLLVPATLFGIPLIASLSPKSPLPIILGAGIIFLAIELFKSEYKIPSENE